MVIIIEKRLREERVNTLCVATEKRCLIKQYLEKSTSLVTFKTVQETPQDGEKRKQLFLINVHHHLSCRLQESFTVMSFGSG